MTLNRFSKLIFSRAATRIFWASLAVSVFLLVKFIVPALDFQADDRSVSVSYSYWLSPILTAFSICFLAAATIAVSRLFITFILPWWRSNGG
jgi:hypothetical protein